MEDIPTLFTDSKYFVVSLFFIDTNYCSFLLKYYLNDEVNHLETIILTILGNDKYKEQINNDIISYVKYQLKSLQSGLESSKESENEGFYCLGSNFYTL